MSSTLILLLITKVQEKNAYFLHFVTERKSMVFQYPDLHCLIKFFGKVGKGCVHMDYQKLYVKICSKRHSYGLCHLQADQYPK